MDPGEEHEQRDGQQDRREEVHAEEHRADLTATEELQPAHGVRAGDRDQQGQHDGADGDQEAVPDEDQEPLAAVGWSRPARRGRCRSRSRRAWATAHRGPAARRRAGGTTAAPCSRRGTRVITSSKTIDDRPQDAEDPALEGVPRRPRRGGAGRSGRLHVVMLLLLPSEELQVDARRGPPGSPPARAPGRRPRRCRRG